LAVQVGKASNQEAAGVDRLRASLRAALPHYMVPQAIYSLDALPLTPNGKVDRAALPPPEQLEAAASVLYVQPEGELERELVAVWQEVLAVPRVGINDNFFDLGGHSLLAVQLHRRLAGVAPSPLSLTDIYRFPTVRALCAHLAGGDGAALERSAQRVETRRGAVSRRELLRKRRQVGRRLA